VIPYLGAEIFSFLQTRYKPEADDLQPPSRPVKRDRVPASAPRRRRSSSVAVTLEPLTEWILWCVKKRSIP
jgi:hypothetical protein